MAEYITRDDVLTLISNSELDQFTNDSSDGSDTASTLTIVITDCSNQVDAYLAAIYTTPFTAPYPAKAKEACLVFTCEALYARRLTPDEKNPFKTRADMWRRLLESIGSGEQPLDVSIPRAFQPGGYTLVIPNRVNDTLL